MQKLSFIIILLFMANLGFSQDFSTLLTNGNNALKNGEYQVAIDFFSKAIVADSKSDSALALRGDAKFQLKMYDDASVDYGSASFIRPSYWHYHKKRGDCYLKMLNYQVAEINYSEAIRFNKNQAEVYYLRGICYQNLGNSTKACSDLSQAYTLGEFKALRYAVDNECEWSKSKTAEVYCPPINAEVITTTEPKSGATIISKGIQIEGCEIKLTASNQPLTRKQISAGEELEIVILKPTGFCGDEKNLVYYGAGYQLVDSKNFELESLTDVYEDGANKMVATNLKSISIYVSLTDIEVGKSYTLKVKFFDKRSKAEVWVEYPFAGK